MFALLSLPLRAERLPLKPFTTADRLAHNAVNKIVRDSRGFLWFCTEEGSVASMSDIVWAINPKRDTLRDVIRKMRRHAEAHRARARLRDLRGNSFARDL